MDVPLVTGRLGINRIIEDGLKPDERDWFKQSVSSLKGATRYVEDAIGMNLEK